MRYVFIFFLFLLGCTKDNHSFIPEADDCAQGNFNYVRDIQPLINANCSGPLCHIPDNGNYDFTNYEAIASSIRQGTFEYRLLLPVDDPQHMPTVIGDQNEVTGRKLDKCDLYKILSWVKQGYPEGK